MSVLNAARTLAATEGVEVAEDLMLAQCTTYRIGGPAA